MSRHTQLIASWLLFVSTQLHLPGCSASLYERTCCQSGSPFINQYGPRPPKYHVPKNLLFPLVDDCSSSPLDLLLVADGSTEYRDHLGKQMEFFSKFLEVFNSGRTDDFTRVNVSLALSCRRNGTTRLDVHFGFGEFSNITDLRQALLSDNASYPDPPHCQASNIGQVHGVSVGHVNTSLTPARNTVIVVVVFDLYGSQYSFNSSDAHVDATINIRILTIVIMKTLQDYRYSTPSVTQLSRQTPGTVAFSVIEELPIDQGVPIIVCHKCYPGWFWDKSDPHKRSLGASHLAFSCYKILPERKIHWIGANKMCGEQSSSLVSIETLDEKQFLEKELLKHNTGNKANMCSESKRFFIGLRRVSGVFRAQYRWVSGLPLVYSPWTEGDFVGVEAGSCVTYKPDCPKSTLRWKSLGCGDEIDAMAVCEATAKMVEEENIEVKSTVSEEKREEALRRGEVAFQLSGDYTFPKGVLRSASYLPPPDSMNKEISFSFYSAGRNKTRTSSNDVKRFQCYRSEYRIPYSKVCDGVCDCPAQDDESVCQLRDRSRDCPYDDYFGGSPPEMDAVYCPREWLGPGACGELMCPDGRSLPTHWFLDGQPDCSTCQGDTSLELAIAARHGVTDCVFSCNRTDCVTRAMLGDKIVDCTGPEGPLDQTLGRLEHSTCYGDNDTSGLTNWGPRCVYFRDPTGGVLGCQNFQHLQNCSHFVCPEGYVKCPNSYCIPVNYVHDYHQDCPLGEDESVMRVDCGGLFQCVMSRQCLHPDRVCDNFRDCPAGDDELSCDVSCREGFLCVSGTLVKAGYNTSVPLTDLSFVDSRTRYLDISGIDTSAGVSTLLCDVTEKLMHVNMSACNMADPDFKICSGRNLVSVLTLDLSYNALNNAHMDEIMSHLLEIRYLNISHNPHVTVARIPRTLRKLVEIDLSFTGVHTLEILPVLHLVHLNLRGTNLSTIRPGLFPQGMSMATLDLRQTPPIAYSLASFDGVTISSLLADTYKLCCPQLHKTLHSCQAPVDPFSSCSDLIGGEYMRVLLWLIGVAALLGNFTAVVNRLMCDRSSLRMAYGHFVAHLSIADFLMGVYLLIIASADNYFRNIYFMHETGWKQGPVCKFAGFLSTLSSEISMFFILLVTLDRFLVIKFPFGQYRISGRYVHVLCALAWLLGLSIALLPFVPSFRHWQTYTFTGVCLGLPLGDRSVPGFRFSLAVFVFLNLFLFLLIAAGQLVIYRALVEVRKSVANQTSSSAMRRAQDVEISRRLFLVAATDFVCWFPVGIMGLIAMAGHPLGYQVYAWSAILIVPINSAINPFLYNLTFVVNAARSIIARRWRKRQDETHELSTGRVPTISHRVNKRMD
ncbi:G-protein coupled receptor GRL101-like [Aplysia californica]|uniref:G-protein coupled receptor GRL101-like n=1 Tax=Aplysia californica TaxID=6500 RepID=A0ABM0KAK5_APLCA|nr:G-protein coupled receptor GRL101-like [Aplysia californica]